MLQIFKNDAPNFSESWLKVAQKKDLKVAKKNLKVA
jgi:hypothetical protein